MPRTALSQDQIAAFRQRVVGAATHLFATEGYEAVTMRALAAELGVSAMTPYRYFEDKDEVFALVRADAFRRFADRQEAASNDVSDDPREMLRRLGRAYIDFALAEPDAYRIMFELGQPTARPCPELEVEQKRAFSYLLDAVEAAGVDGNELTAAHLAWAQVHGIVSLHLAGKLIMGRSIEELVSAMFHSEEER